MKPQYSGLDNSVIQAASERNPAKWGKVTVGTRIPSIPVDEAHASMPDFFLDVPWHFVTEFKAREQEILLSGGRFIVPMPHFSII
jgi:hypothetical protein